MFAILQDIGANFARHGGVLGVFLCFLLGSFVSELVKEGHDHYIKEMASFYTKNQFLIFTSFVLLSLFIGTIAPRTMAYIPGVLGLLFVGTLHKHLKDLFPFKLTALVFGIIAMGLASAFHSPDVDFALERVGKIACILLPSLLFIAVCRHKEMLPLSSIMKILIVFHIAVGVFLYTERTNDHQLSSLVLGKNVAGFHSNRAFVVFSLWSILLAFICMAQSRKLLAAIVILSSAITFSVSESQTGQLAFVFGILVLLFLPAHRIVVTRSLLAAIVVFSIASPFLMTPLKNTIPEKYLMDGILKQASIIYRLEVWQHSAQKTLEKPIFGHGIEALRFLKSNEWMKYQKADSILHSHNAALQVWVEFGLIGILLACGFVAYLFRRIEKVPDRNTQKLYMTMLLTCLCISFTGYGLWQSWQLGMFIFFSGFSIIVSRQTSIKAA